MSLDRLDPLLSSPKKLAALGALASAQQVEFVFLRNHLGLSDSDLSKQMSALVSAGYVTARKTGRGAQRKTWYRSTESGSGALRDHIDALNDLVLDPLPAPTQAN